MERFELEENLKEEIRRGVLGDGFMKIVQTVRRNGKTFRIAIRPVEIGGVRKYQAEMTDEGRVTVKNFDSDAIAEGLEEVIAQRGARELHLMTAKGDLHLRVTRRGKAHVSRSAEMNRAVETRGHDRVKNVPLNRFDSSALLRVIGLADGSGQIRASMRGKYDQVNEFLKVVEETVGECSGQRSKVKGQTVDFKEFHCLPSDLGPLTSASTSDLGPLTSASTSDLDLKPRPSFTAIDCGCGKAYLTISLYFFLTQALGYPDVTVIGIDRRADVIAAARKMAEALDVADKVRFAEADLTDFDLAEFGKGERRATRDASGDARQETRDSRRATRDAAVDLVVSLHACDTATDEALAKGVEWKARYILSAPCCQHELQKTITSASSVAFSGLLRQGILRERLCDLLTDAYRAMILRILGFKTQVVEFVSSEATARNIMLKCEYGVKPGQPGPVGEYLELRDYWKVTPWLETRLQNRLKPHLDRFVL